MEIEQYNYDTLYNPSYDDCYELSGACFSHSNSYYENYNNIVKQGDFWIISNTAPRDAFVAISKNSLYYFNYGEKLDNIKNFNFDIIKQDAHKSKEAFLYQDILLDSKKFLGLNISTISTILKISRPTVYSYLKGNSVGDFSNFDKIKKLRLILTIVREKYKLNSFPSLFKHRDNDGNSLVEYFSNDLPELEKFVNSICISEIERRKKIKNYDNKIKLNKEAFSTPIFHEE